VVKRQGRCQNALRLLHSLVEWLLLPLPSLPSAQVCAASPPSDKSPRPAFRLNTRLTKAFVDHKQAESTAADAAMAVATIFLEWFTTQTSTSRDVWASPLAQAATANPGAWRALASAATRAQATANTLQVCTYVVRGVASRSESADGRVSLGAGARRAAAPADPKLCVRVSERG